MPRKKILRCPKCGHRFVAENGDDLHPYCSTKKPKESGVIDGSIITQVCDCPNKECLHPINVYWYQTKGYFRLM